jgi:hypothetical protein
MGDVVFFSRSRRYGNKGVVGPVTGIKYVITVEGTPVSAYDADALSAMTEPPCCGQHLPFDGKVKSFGISVPTAKQLEDVPQYLWDFELEEPEPEKPKRKRKYTKYKEPEEVVEEEVEPVEKAETTESDLLDWEVN